MISRIRLDAFGITADAVAATLYPHADEIEKMLGVAVIRGECVIERDLNVPEDSEHAFKGRLLIYPDTSKPVGNTITFSGHGAAVSWTGTGTSTNSVT